ncbi:MAG: anhydro-N-acetylmuramic acid kinase [Bacteroidota bacterium]
MNLLQSLQKKKSKIVIGLMSGTSVDGIDAAVVELRENGTSTRLKQIAFQTFAYPKGYRELVLMNSLPGAGSVEMVCRLNILAAQFFADAVKRVTRHAGLSLSQIDLIGSHGQTIHHLPAPRKMFGKKVRSTLQIGDPSTIAALTGIPTVGDFRMADLAVGGQGAPLVPYFDFLLLRSKSKNRLVLNLGGIANFTVLPANCRAEDVLAFDTGPANMVIDALMMRYFRKPFDRNGAIASQGKILPKLLRWMTGHGYLKQRPPKSTGREVFGEMFIREILKRSRGERREDVIATATEFTAASVYDQYKRFVRRRHQVDEVIVSGGGVHNRFVTRSLARLFAPARILKAEDFGYSSDAKEALLFAILANETISGNPSNIPGATGARKSVILGKICL